MNRRPRRNTNIRTKEVRGSSKEKKPDQLVTPRSPIKNQRKRHIDSVSGNASDSESPDPLKKSPKVTVPAHGLGSESPERPKKSSKGTVQAHRLGSKSLRKSAEKDGASVGRYLQKMPDGPRVTAKGNLELQPHPEPEEMDCSDDFNSVSPDEMQSEGDDVLTASAQNTTDEDVDSESEMEADGLQDSTEPLTRQTSSGYGTNQITHKADIYQPTKYKETQNYTAEKQSGSFIKPSVAADIRQPMKYKKTQNYTAEKQNRWLMKPRVAADIRQPMKYKDTQNYTDVKQSRQFIKPSVTDYGIKQATQKGARFFWKLVIPITGLIAVLIACIFCLWISKVTDQSMLMERQELFLSKWKEMKTMFPKQQHDLWMRSSILLKKHIGTAVHTQPVILMFAAAQDASGTMQCLARRIGEAYASVFNSSTLEINGSDTKSLNSDRVKLELDEQLSSAFQEGGKAAIIHHFQDLPPPSTLLFYKYCDHENAAFKDISLLITVLLDEPELKPNMPLRDLEEIVMDFLKKKFCSDTPGEFNIMDADKLGGLWSRISHLVLPVRLEREIEDGDCPVLK
ncbi:torsin-1A-interacting protein 2-like isoform X2 [Scyliorhinus canicula]|uniref:torsin-1A-interacting protein 2-like isoform X2 n=1 Tax=Scyliorhinus canicula TaxID=7830 RepID=UPI0018F309A3|nr:torsin-1A-interacting protein 2-like isoform X2 [Scyliorhinus canicula]